MSVMTISAEREAEEMNEKTNKDSTPQQHAEFKKDDAEIQQISENQPQGNTSATSTATS